MFEETQSSPEGDDPLAWVSLRSFSRFFPKEDNQTAPKKQCATRPKRDLSIKIEEEDAEESVLSKTGQLPHELEDRFSRRDEIEPFKTLPEDKLSALLGTNNRDYDAFFQHVEKIKSRCSSRSKTPVRSQMSVGSATHASEAQHIRQAKKRADGTLPARARTGRGGILTATVPSTAASILGSSGSLQTGGTMDKEDPPDFSFAGAK